jgi:hypothetical protein
MVTTQKAHFSRTHAQITIYCVLIKNNNTIFGGNISIKPFWVLIIK